MSFQPCMFHNAMHLVINSEAPIFQYGYGPSDLEIGKAHRSQPHTKAWLDVTHERHHNSTGASCGMLYQVYALLLAD